jgi:predicted MPP superfamily phosphohydrolase
MRYRWLHLSDLHSITSGIKTTIMRESLIAEIQDINRQRPFDFIIITGDISDKNNGYQYAESLIKRIIAVTDVPLLKVFMIPGNHDLNRCIPDEREQIIREVWEIELLDEGEREYYDKLNKAQNDFFDTYENVLGRKYPKDKIHFADSLDDNIAIIHLNTAWMCYDSENESGKLHVGLNSLIECLSEPIVKTKPIKIAIGHHRISDFSNCVEAHIKSLYKTMDIDLYLCGHCHDATVVYDPSIKTEFCSCRQGRAEDKDYPAGFIVGEINTETDQSHFQFYNWEVSLAKWTYDYRVTPAKHGKYYLHGEKFTKTPEASRNIIVDFKLYGVSLDYDSIMKAFNIENSAIYRSSIQNIRPKSTEEWNACLNDVINIYESIIKNSNKAVHIFPIAAIPLLVAFGYLLQNDNPNINIYQYFENEDKWVCNEQDDNINIVLNSKANGSKILAVSVSVSASIDIDDIETSINDEFDLLSIGIDNPRLSYLNYYADVQRLKKTLKIELDRIYYNYDEIHLFLAAPAGVCIEVGRIIRENMYPSTFVYYYQRLPEGNKYTRIYNLKAIRY